MSGRRFVLAIDQGTTSTRAIVFDEEGRPCASAQVPLTQIYPAPGEVEHDPEEIWQSVLKAGRAALKDIGAQSVAAIGITNQRETTIVWERATGKPLANAIVWQDRRTARHCDELKGEGWGAHVEETTGLVIDPYFSATKLAWLLANVPGLRRAGAQRRGVLRHGRQLSPVQADRRQGPCDRGEQRRPHDALRHQAWRMGRQASRPPRHPARNSAGASRQPGRFRRDRARAFRRCHPDQRHRRRSAGGGLWSGLLSPRHAEGDLRHRLLPARQYRRGENRLDRAHARDRVSSA